MTVRETNVNCLLNVQRRSLSEEGTVIQVYMSVYRR